MLSERIHYLANKYFSDACTAEEKEELARWVSQAGDDVQLRTLLASAWEKHTPSLDMPEDMSERILGKVFEKQKQTPVLRLPWRRVAAVAAILLVLGAGTYFLLVRNENKPVPTVQTTRPKEVPAPAVNRATITLANGQQIYLDSVPQGSLADQKGVQLQKLADGRISYSGVSTELMYNTLTNPRGSRVIDISLADGSRVWLNAGSSLTYPVAFANGERKVTVNGEAYFEITHDTKKPFIVNKGTTDITVLGTRFNVKAYDEEKNTKITLLEGSVRVKAGASAAMLKPGEQAALKPDNQLSVHTDADTEAAIAWKNGRFRFEGTGVEETLREIARWYDVEIVYAGRPAEQHFGGGISRNVPMSKVFEMLENTGVLHVKTEGKKIIVLP